LLIKYETLEDVVCLRLPMANTTLLQWPDSSMAVTEMSLLWGLDPHALYQGTISPGWFGDKVSLLLAHLFFFPLLYN
jgi:hypothetical protein